jgi:mRNA-degrading endonuclease RelE of RelBE toxin-antitoxin system
MSYDVKAIPRFEKDLKKLVKKYPSLKKEFIELIVSLKLNPTQGTYIGNNCFKIRMAIASKGKGKSSGARIITYIQIAFNAIYLLTIYDKSDQDSISNKEILELLLVIPESE